MIRIFVRKSPQVRQLRIKKLLERSHGELLHGRTIHEIMKHVDALVVDIKRLRKP